MEKPRPPALAQERFRAHRTALEPLDLRARFDYIYRTNLWGCEESRSGVGSAPAETARLRLELAALLKRLEARTLLDIPCGDFLWMRELALEIDYTGADIVEDLVRENQARYATGRRRFVALDLTSDPLPAAGVVLCRDCLVHLSFANIFSALENLKRSGSRYLLTTTFLECEGNLDVTDGDWRPLNLVKPPFSLGTPEAVILEGCTECGGAYADKALALWKIADLP